MKKNKLLKKKIFYHGFYFSKKSIIFQLHEKYNWVPVVINAHKKDFSELKFFGDSLILDNFLIRRGNFPKNIKLKIIPIDKKIVNLISNKLISYFDTFSDTTGWNYSFNERKMYYYDAISFWYSILIESKPDYFISFKNPHTTTCYLIYLLCKHVLNIKTYFFDVAPLFNSERYMIFSSYEKNFNNLLKVSYTAQTNDSSSENIKKYIDEIKREKTPKHIVEYYVSNKNKTPFDIIKFFKFIMYSILNLKKYDYETDFKVNQKKYSNLTSRASKLQFFLFMEQYKKKNRKLKKFYLSKIHKPNLNEKFIYFASSYQPEARTYTMCDVFEDQILALKILRSSFPEDIKIYFKENASIFLETNISRGSLKRSEDYYNKLINIKNLNLIDYDFDTFKLIDNSIAVSTLAGTVGWESIIRKKPALVFGVSWYTMCKNIFNIETLEDCKSASEKILNGFIPDERETFKYLHSIEKCSYQVNIRKFEMITDNENLQSEAQKIADAFYDNTLKNDK